MKHPGLLLAVIIWFTLLAPAVRADDASDVKTLMAAFVAAINAGDAATANQPQEGPWRLTAFLTKQSGTWKISHCHFSEYSRLRYLLHLPDAYATEREKKWPLFLYLHGAGERGENLSAVKVQGAAKVAEEGDLPFIVLSPQCPRESRSRRKPWIGYSTELSPITRWIRTGST